MIMKYHHLAKGRRAAKLNMILPPCGNKTNTHREKQSCGATFLQQVVRSLIFFFLPFSFINNLSLSLLSIFLKATAFLCGPRLTKKLLNFTTTFIFSYRLGETKFGTPQNCLPLLWQVSKLKMLVNALKKRLLHFCFI